MYHYTESGLKNQYLANGYRQVQTAYGPSIVIQSVERLHECIASMLVEDKPFLTGPEFRFIRKTLGLTQGQIAEIGGYDEQTARRWESLGRVPKWADHIIRYVYRDYENGKEPIRGAIEGLRELEQQRYEAKHYQWKLGAGRAGRWRVTQKAA